MALGCYLSASLVMLGFGITYLSRSEFMPYHAHAAGVAWSDLTPRMQALMLTLLKALGGAYVAATFAFLVVLFIPFRQGAPWAVWFVPVFGVLLCAAPLNAMAYLASRTPATPPWWSTSAALALVSVGFLCSMLDRS